MPTDHRQVSIRRYICGQYVRVCQSPNRLHKTDNRSYRLHGVASQSVRVYLMQDANKRAPTPFVGRNRRQGLMPSHLRWSVQLIHQPSQQHSSRDSPLYNLNVRQVAQSQRLKMVRLCPSLYVVRRYTSILDRGEMEGASWVVEDCRG